jgi:hypothetical protein
VPRAGGAVLGLRFELMPGKASVSHAFTYQDDDELLVWLLSNPRHSKNEALALWDALKDDD